MPEARGQCGKPCTYYALGGLGKRVLESVGQALSPAFRVTQRYATRRTLEMMAASSGGRLRRISLISSSHRIALSSSERRGWSFRSCALGGGKARRGAILLSAHSSDILSIF